MAAAEIITAAGAALSAIAGGYSAASAPAKTKKQFNRQKELMGMSDQYAKENATLAYERQLALYKQAYQDESYAARKKQMEEAGLNVGLMYSGGAGGGGGAGQIGNTAAPGGPSPGQAPGGAEEAMVQQRGMAMTMDAMQRAASIKLTEKQAENLEADTNLKETQAGKEESAEKLNMAEAKWVESKNEGQRLQNDFDSLRNEIGQATKKWQMEKVEYEASVWFEESEMAYEKKMQSIEDTERARATTEDYIAQTGLATKTMIMELIQTKAKTELTEAQVAEVYRTLELTAEGNQIKWDQNRITELLGNLHVEQSDRRSILGVIEGILTAGISLWGTSKIARAMGGSAKTGGRAAGTKTAVGVFNSSTGTVSWE